jgi:putative phosphoribosyl transferase
MLGCPLDVVLVRKIGAPGQEELALGAIVDGAQPQVVLNEDIVRAVSPRPEYMATVERRELAEIERRRKLYGGGKEETRGRTVIVVDDGVATGAKAKAALRALR